MKKTNYLWLGAVVVIILLAVYLVMSLNGPAAPTGETNNPAEQDQNTAPNANADLTGSGSAATKTPAAPLPVPGKDEAGAPAPTNGGTITASGSSFTPKGISAKAGSKIMLTFAATDDKRHTFAFSDPRLSFILVTFSKTEGNKSISFPVPAAGNYEFYVDNQKNTGTLNVQ